MKAKLFFISIGIILFCAFCNGQNTKGIIQKNESIAKSFIEYLNSHDVGKFTSLFAENGIYEEVATGRSYTNRQKIAVYIGSTISGIPDTKFETINMMATNNLAVV